MSHAQTASSLTLLGNSRWVIANATGVRVTKGMYSIPCLQTLSVRPPFLRIFDLPNRVIILFTPVRSEADL
jgi:hypothetical protein